MTEIEKTYDGGKLRMSVLNGKATVPADSKNNTSNTQRSSLAPLNASKDQNLMAETVSMDVSSPRMSSYGEAAGSCPNRHGHRRAHNWAAYTSEELDLMAEIEEQQH